MKRMLLSPISYSGHDVKPVNNLFCPESKLIMVIFMLVSLKQNVIEIIEIFILA
jgi:hypothetical protein